MTLPTLPCPARPAGIRNGPRSARPVNLTRPGAANTWFRIQNRAAPTALAAAEADIYLMDEIGGWGVTAGEFVSALQQVDAKKINLHINSPGGDVFDGVAIYNALAKHPAAITVYIDGLAASAASFIAMAGDEIIACRGSMLMIHDASGFCMGPAGEMRSMADLLDKVSDTIAGIYATRTGKPADGWRAAMLATTWYMADEAVAAGLVDRTEDVEDPEATATAQAWARTMFNRTPDAAPAATSGVAVGADGSAEAIVPATVGAELQVQLDEARGGPGEPADPEASEAAGATAGEGAVPAAPAVPAEPAEQAAAVSESVPEPAAAGGTVPAAAEGQGETATTAIEAPAEGGPAVVAADAAQTPPATAPPAPAVPVAEPALPAEPPTASAALQLGTPQIPGASQAREADTKPPTTDEWGDLVAALAGPPSPRTVDDMLAALKEAVL